MSIFGVLYVLFIYALVHGAVFNVLRKSFNVSCLFAHVCTIALILVSIILVPLLIIIIRILVIAPIEDALYARTYFAEKVPIERVLESKRWHSMFTDEFMGFACTYAIVETQEEYLDHKANAREDYLVWREAMIKIPDREIGKAMGYCFEEWGPANRSLVHKALKDPETYYHQHHSDEIVEFYSEKYNVAGWIRYGD